MQSISQTEQRPEPWQVNPALSIRTITEPITIQPRRESVESLSTVPYPPISLPATPPDSVSGSPKFSSERLDNSSQREWPTLPRLALVNPRTEEKTLTRLPSLEEFDEGVEALVRSFGPAPQRPAQSPLPYLNRHSFRRQSLPRQRVYAADDGYSSPSLSSVDAMSTHMRDQYFASRYPSPPPDGENRHINQKYTTEEGDYIIYAWHDKKMKWQRIQQEFAAMFGRTPERTVQGLQAWYYRMNGKIPVWNEDGWLIFEHEDDLEPKCVSMKVRDNDAQEKPMEPLGIAKRYPERAMYYSWVDEETKRKASDWAAKRIRQYSERRERRRRKELRRVAKL